MHLCVMLSDDETMRFVRILDLQLEIKRIALKALRAAEAWAECDEVKRELHLLLKLRELVQKWQNEKEATR